MSEVVEKIRKLLALSRGVANEHEAALAAERARQLLEENNLTLLEVDREEEPETGEAVHRISVAAQSYERVLAGAAAKLCDCEAIEIPCVAFWYGRKQVMYREMRFCGIAVSARASLELFLYLRAEVKGLWCEREKQLSTRQRKSYLAGAALRIRDEADRLKAQHVSAQSLAIIRIGTALAKRHMDQRYAGRESRHVAVKLDQAFAVGYADGGAVALQPKRKSLQAGAA